MHVPNRLAGAASLGLLLVAAACSHATGTGGAALLPDSQPSTTSATRGAPTKSARILLGEELPALVRGNSRELREMGPNTVAGTLIIAEDRNNQNPLLAQYKIPNHQNNGPVCTNSANYSANGITTDKSHNLWSTQHNTSGVAVVIEYAPNCGAVLNTLNDFTSSVPNAVAFNKKGVAFVTSLFGPNFTNGGLAVYPPGATSPKRFLRDGSVKVPIGVAIDSASNVYTTGYPFGVYEFPKGKGAAIKLPITGYCSSSSCSGLTGVAFDKQQNLIVVDPGPPAQEEVYAPPYSGAPTYTIANFADSDPFGAALNRQNTQLFVADIGTASVNVYAYPSGTYLYSITTGMGTNIGQPYGITIY